MKIAICTQTANSDSGIDLRFGRCEYLSIYDDQTKLWEFIANSQNFQASEGAGLQTAQQILDANAGIVIAMNVGPKAMTVLQAEGIDVYQARKMTAIEAIDKLENNELKQITEANVQGHWI